MVLNIIHLPHRKDRWASLQQELSNQHILHYKIWPGIIDEEPCRGIAKAHKQIVAYAKKENLSSILVAEDDLKFTAKGAFEYFLKSQPTDYDLYLGGISYGTINENNITADFAGLTLYQIHAKFYDTFLSIDESQDIDRLLQAKGKYVVCYPLVAVQQNGFSDNKKEHCNYDDYIKGRKLFGQ